MFSRRFSLRIHLKYFKTQIILFTLILKVITSICNETIFHLIVKSTLAKLCGVRIVYLIYLLTEMKCHGGMFSYRVQWLIKCRINDTINRKFNCLGALIFQSCKPVIVASVFQFLLALQLLLARPASIKWILLATRNFHSPLASGHFPHCMIIIKIPQIFCTFPIWFQNYTLLYYLFPLQSTRAMERITNLSINFLIMCR